LTEAYWESFEPTNTVTLVRDGQTITQEMNLKEFEAQTAAGKRVVYTLPATFLGESVSPDPFIEVYANPLTALAFGFEKTMAMSWMMVTTIGKLFIGDVPLQALGGPIMIAKVAGDSARDGWQTFVTTMALISVNLAIINLFPIPVLDGGQLVLIGAEAIRRRRLSDIAIENFQKVGFVMVLGLIVLATYNDLSRFWSAMLRGVMGTP